MVFNQFVGNATSYDVTDLTPNSLFYARLIVRPLLASLLFLRFSFSFFLNSVHELQHLCLLTSFCQISNTGPDKATSTWSSFFTSQVAPLTIGAPQTRVLSSSSIFVSWTHSADGAVGISYQLYQDDSVIYDGPAAVFEVTSLLAYTQYSFYLVVCNLDACSDASGSTTARTLPALPVGVVPLQVSQVDARYMIASWQPPSTANGPIFRYTIEVRVPIVWGSLLSHDCL